MNDAPIAVVVFGPQGSGKSRYAQQIRRHFGMQSVVDPWRPGQRIVHGALHLSHDQLIEGSFGGVLHVDIEKLPAHIRAGERGHERGLLQKRMPRTLQEAFGPYTDSQIENNHRPRDPLWVRCFYWVICVLATGLFLVQLTGCDVLANAEEKRRKGWANEYVHTLKKTPVDEHGVVCYGASGGAISCVKVR